MTLPIIAPERLDPFDGFFRNHGPSPVPPDGLLDLPAVRRWFALLSWGDEEGLYTYQMPLEGRTGSRVLVLGRSRLMLSCYDYLGLAGHPAVEDAAITAVRTYGTGTGGVRMLTGTTALHRDLEREIAAFKDVEAALAFGSGYLANLAVVAALFGPRDRVLIDARAHRSLYDACVLARVPVCFRQACVATRIAAPGSAQSGMRVARARRPPAWSQEASTAQR